MDNDIKVKCTFSSLRFKNKPDSGGARKVQFDLKPTNITIKDLSDALVHGASFRPGVLYGRSKNDWKEQQLYGLDFDHNTTIEEKYNKAMMLGIKPCFMYTTFSHSEEEHKFRMVFCNNKVITDGNYRDKLQATLMGIMEDAIDLMISNITLNKFKELCPQADKNIKYAKDTFLMMLSIARNNVYSEKFSNDDGEIVFFVTTKKIAECLGKDYSQSKIDKIGKYIKMLIYHDLIRILDDEQVPKELLFKAIKYSGTDKRTGKHVNFYAIPSWVIQQLSTIENNGVRWKEKGYRIAGVSFDMFYRSEGFDVAASIYPQYKKKKNEYGEIVDRSTTKASDERTLKISEIILQCIQRKGYCTEKEVVYILGNKYRYEVTETQIKRSLNEIMDLYGLKKVKANKALKEQYHIKSDGYPNIIIEDVA